MYSLPASTAAVSGDTISSTKWNSLTQDLEADNNAVRPIVAGGTGGATALAGLTALFSGASPGGADKIGFWDQSAASFAFLSLGTGLSFNGTTLELDADLSTLAGLTVAADNFIVGNSGGTAWEVKTPANARTSLGLGTAATVNTGTSGATIPLLNGANTFDLGTLFGSSGAQAIIGRTHAGSEEAIAVYHDGTNGIVQSLHNGTAWQPLRLRASALSFEASGVGGDQTIWHAGNDGAGSGLDADTVDGVQGSAFAQLTATNVFVVANDTTDSLRITNSGNSKRLHLRAGEVASQNADLLLDAEDGNNILLQTSGTTRATVGPTGFFARTQASSETSGTLTSASANKTIQLAGTITINNSVFTAGDIIVVYAGAASRSIAAGTITTMRLDGTSTTGSRTLAARGMATIFFVSATECVVSGAAVT